MPVPPPLCLHSFVFISHFLVHYTGTTSLQNPTQLAWIWDSALRSVLLKLAVPVVLHSAGHSVVALILLGLKPPCSDCDSMVDISHVEGALLY